MVVVVFRSRLREGIDLQALERLGARMYELATAMPGFLSYKEFAAEDGEQLSLVEFDSLETLADWKNHPEHLEGQRRGREEFFLDYRIQICLPERDYSFSVTTPDRPTAEVAGDARR